MDKILQPNEVIRYIVGQYGADIFSDTKKLSALLMDFIPEKIKHRNILKIAINAGIPNKILIANHSEIGDKKLVSQQCKLILSEDYCIEEQWSVFAVNCFTDALEWDTSYTKDDNEILADIIRKFYNS